MVPARLINKLYSIILVVLGAGACGSPSPTPSSPNIYGGQPVSPGDFQQVMGLAFRQGEQDKFTIECTGTLIHPKLILTAGHCLKSGGFDIDHISSPLAEHLRIYRGPGVEGGVVEATIQPERAGYHPMLRAHPLGNADIGYVVLAEPLADISPAQWAGSAEILWRAMGTNKRLTLVGYGQREDQGVGRKYQVEANLRQWNGHEATVGGDGRDACLGDSGGPAFARVGDALVQTGVVSRGIAFGCGQGGKISQVADAACWLQQDSGVDLNLASDCDQIAPTYTGEQLARIQLDDLCAGAANLSQKRTLMAMQWVTATDSCGAAVKAINQSTTLNLDHTYIDDLSPLVGFPHLQQLSLIGNRIQHVFPLSHLPHLSKIELGANDIVDFHSLDQLLAGGTTILGRRTQLSSYTDTEFLSACLGLEKLPPDAALTVRKILWKTQTDQCEQANHRLLSMTSLNLAERGITNLQPLSGLPRLTTLNLADNPLTDVSPLAGMESLKKLNLTGTAVEDVSPLQPLIDSGLQIKGLPAATDQ